MHIRVVARTAELFLPALVLCSHDFHGQNHPRQGPAMTDK